MSPRKLIEHWVQTFNRADALNHTFAIFLCFILAGCASTRSLQRVVDDALPLDPALFQDASVDQFESGSFTSSRGTRLPYRLLRPSRQVIGRTYPLVVVLHGSGAIGDDNISQLGGMARSWAMPGIRERYQAFVLIPQFPARSANYESSAPDQYAVSSTVLEDALELIRSFSSANAVDRSRVYATGFSMGGSSTWLLPQMDGTVFAGIVPIAGIAPADSAVDRFTDLPVLAIHGNADTENPIAADRRFMQAISSHGGRKCMLRVYQGLEHAVPRDMYPGMWWRDWLFDQRRK